jgi:uncharacterized Ntn-hydrolase superfamily protein
MKRCKTQGLPIFPKVVTSVTPVTEACNALKTLTVAVTTLGPEVVTKVVTGQAEIEAVTTLVTTSPEKRLPKISSVSNMLALAVTEVTEVTALGKGTPL